jgi:hypothetical protein
MIVYNSYADHDLWTFLLSSEYIIPHREMCVNRLFRAIPSNDNCHRWA